MHVRIEFIDGDKTGQEKNEAWNGQRVNRYKSTNDIWGNVAREMVEATLKWREKRVSGRREDVSEKSGMRTQKIICCHFSLVKREAWWQRRWQSYTTLFRILKVKERKGMVSVSQLKSIVFFWRVEGDLGSSHNLLVISSFIQIFPNRIHRKCTNLHEAPLLNSYVNHTQSSKYIKDDSKLLKGMWLIHLCSSRNYYSAIFGTSKCLGLSIIEDPLCHCA